MRMCPNARLLKMAYKVHEVEKVQLICTRFCKGLTEMMHRELFKTDITVIPNLYTCDFVDHKLVW